MASQAELLDIPVEFEYFGEYQVFSLRHYLRMLLSDLWNFHAEFDGKRPYGSSIWKFDVYKALIASGHIDGSLDENGFVQELDKDSEKLADKMISDLIRDIFRNG